MTPSSFAPLPAEIVETFCRAAERECAVIITQNADKLNQMVLEEELSYVRFSCDDPTSDAEKSRLYVICIENDLYIRDDFIRLIRAWSANACAHGFLLAEPLPADGIYRRSKWPSVKVIGKSYDRDGSVIREYAEVNDGVVREYIDTAVGQNGIVLRAEEGFVAPEKTDIRSPIARRLAEIHFYRKHPDLRDDPEETMKRTRNKKL